MADGKDAADLPASWTDTLSRLGRVGQADATRSIGRRSFLPERSVATAHRRGGSLVVPRAPTTRRFLADEISGRGWSFAERYRLLRQLERGASADSHLAEQVFLGREITVKILRDASDPVQRAALANEARQAGRLTHPNIVTIHDAGDDHLAMRQLRGVGFHEVAGRVATGAATLAEAIEALARAADAVAYAHSRGVLHRDLRPEHLVVGDFGEVWVTGWGHAVELVGEVGAQQARFSDLALVCIGTPAWLAPEAARGEAPRIGPASDLFQLGANVYRLLTGQPPFPAATSWASLALAAAARRPTIAELNPDAPAPLVAACERAMAAEPADRGTVAEFATALRTWLFERSASSEAVRLIAVAGRRLGEATLAAAVAARTDAEAALDLCPGHPGAIAVRDAAVTFLADAALAEGDLNHAAALARSLSGSDQPIAKRIKAEQVARVGRQWWAGVATATAIVVALTAGAAFLAAVVTMPPPPTVVAAQLVAEALALPRPNDPAALPAYWAQRLSLTRRAAALDPESAHAATMVAADTAAWAAVAEPGLARAVQEASAAKPAGGRPR
ncbi:hypothetical protein LBMAG53_12090 [Planctomycetota bacterium]|nr:hypothetical protein LBMAG53_12090 [Planctomycetota bacterium]